MISRAISTAIYPTRRAVWLSACGAPLALGLALAAPGLWIAGLGWIVAIAALIALDGKLAPPPRSVRFGVCAPEELAAPAGRGEAVLSLDFPELDFLVRAPARLQAALQVSDNLALASTRVDVDPGAGAVFALSAVRRGEGRLERAWARWTGPLGLLQLQAAAPLDHAVRVVPDLQAVRREAMRLFARSAMTGQKSRPEVGDGFEFQALKEHQPGMDPRAIDWKQSARHGLLLAKEFRVERNHPIMLILDSGRLMGEPVEGASKLDRAVNAALLIAYVALALGDRVGLSAFDARPRLVGKPVAGASAFATLLRMASRIEATSQETNFTLGLSAVGAALDRRALVVVFTDFADPTSAQLMLESTGRLADRHLVLFVLFEDAELEAARSRQPVEPADVSRAVTADALLREREGVVASLRRLGAEVVEARASAVGSALIERYLSLKRLDRL